MQERHQQHQEEKRKKNQGKRRRHAPKRDATKRDSQGTTQEPRGAQKATKPRKKPKRKQDTDGPKGPACPIGIKPERSSGASRRRSCARSATEERSGVTGPRSSMRRNMARAVTDENRRDVLCKVEAEVGFGNMAVSQGV